MYKGSNTMVRNAVVAMQHAIETGNKDNITDAFEKFGEAIAASVQADFESANGDRNILLQRGFRVLTSDEQKYYEKVIEAGKQGTIQQMNGLLTPEVMPITIIEDVYRNLTEEHPLLARINFQSVEYLTRWIMNDHSVQTAHWGNVNDAITKQITSAFKTVEITQCKLSAYAVIELDMLDLGPTFLDGYIRAFLQEALYVALENAIISGTGHNMPVGMDRDIHQGVTVNTSTGYPAKAAIPVASFMPQEYGKVLANLAVTEVYYTQDSTGNVADKATAANADGSAKAGYTKHGGNIRSFDQVTLICNMVDYLTKVMPATTVLNAEAKFVNNLFPFPTEVIRSSAVPTGKAIICLPEEYFMGVGTSKTGTMSYSDEFKFLDDQRVFKIKMHAMGKAFDNTVAIVIDISNLDPGYITVLNKEVPTA